MDRISSLRCTKAAAIAVGLLLLFSTAHAETTLQSLKAQIEELQRQIQTLQNSITQTPTGFTFQRTLVRGASGEDVRQLQEFLKNPPTGGSNLYPEGLVTGYFGVLTEKAVKRFQAKYGIESIGIVGPKTKRMLNSLGAAGPPSPLPSILPKAQVETASLTKTPPLCDAVNINSFSGCYYDDENFTNLQISHADPKINFNWFDGSPDPAIGVDTFSIRWQGKFDFEEAQYQFVIAADDGMRLTVDGEILIDKWFNQARTIYSAKKSLSRGQHLIAVDYYENSGQASAELYWEKTTPPYFRYNWRASSTLTGDVEVVLPTAIPRPVIVLDGKPTITIDTSAAVRLAEIYKVVLVNDEVPWDESTAGMMLEMVRRLNTTWSKFGHNIKTWRVSLTNASFPNDVELKPFTEGSSIREARFTKAAFARSNPTLQPASEGNPDRVFYSNRLFRAVLEAFFRDRYLLEDLLKERYSVAIGKAEPIDEFQDFTNEELRYLISVFEDVPEGFRSIPGLEKIVRRKNGLTNPFSPAAPAIAWVDGEYIEFMDFAFSGQSLEYIRRLIAHEITHFLWHKVFTPETQKEFMALSGWAKEPGAGLENSALAVSTDHPKSVTTKQRETWYRKTTTNFVSGYAAGINPDEDFAETVSYYIYQPDWVRTITPDKYNFVKRIAEGYEYVILVDKKFTFQVFNLEPDLVFPGKIVGIDIEVVKLPSGDNEVTATLHLSPKYGDGAEQAYARIVSPTDTYLDVGFNPVDGNKFMLRAKFTINKFMAHGYWAPGQITVQDKVDNRRYESQNQFGWLMFVDNSEADNDPPVADTNNIRGELKEVDGEQTVLVYVPATDKNEKAGLSGYATLQQYESGQSTYNYAQHDSANRRLVFTFPIRKYKASGAWSFREFWVADAAGNWGRYDLKEKELTFSVITKNPDSLKPGLDVDSIRIQAIPTRPEAPNGETDVTIWYRARDDNSGLGWVNYIIIKPTGDKIHDYHYHDNFYTDYFTGGLPTEWKEYQINLRLPAGSPPGVWILEEIDLNDKAGNKRASNFVEIGILKPLKFEVK